MNRLFLSWSGEPSRTVALALKRWLPNVIHALDPWVSHEDISPGDRWSSEVSKALAGTEFGIVCVTEVNLNSAWLNFEAGALAKTLDQGRVFPYLISMRAGALAGPLAQFQGVPADKTGTFSLLRSVNRLLDKPLDSDRLSASFEKWWPDLENVVQNLPHPSRELETSGADWPTVKTISSLRKIIACISDTQRRLLFTIITADSRFGGDRADGISPHMLQKTLSLGRGEILYRCKDLERLGLIDIDHLSDYCYRPTDSVFALLEGTTTSAFENTASPRGKHSIRSQSWDNEE